MIDCLSCAHSKPSLHRSLSTRLATSRTDRLDIGGRLFSTPRVNTSHTASCRHEKTRARVDYKHLQSYAKPVHEDGHRGTKHSHSNMAFSHFQSCINPCPLEERQSVHAAKVGLVVNFDTLKSVSQTIPRLPDGTGSL